ncbi:hypothetical protein QF011_000043 [Curtobacterium flaccumfaciens]|nr:hypothetical protein [Curtobacterium flaccumfaciens]MDQ0537513.1 hypothetical protein [Curtobacterium flaccumfaciens]
MTDSEALQPSARLRRIRVLSAELDNQRQFALDRGKTQESKASFVLVVVGLVVSVGATRLSGTPLWPVGLLPVAAALAAATEAVFVLWPRRIAVVDSAALVVAWVDNEQPQDALEDYLLESKRQEISERDARQKTSTPHLRRAFQLLLASITILIAVAIIDGFSPQRGDTPITDQPTPTSSPSSEPAGAQRPNTEPTMQTLYASNPEQARNKEHD